ncbi:thaumatin, partial [Radiomyces spectabilis]|uniref:thaumatin n=1 Tax=Radiomyces spectabilis TaxID=64574 RepID=UPI0022203304
ASAPMSNGVPYIVVQNDCDHSIIAGESENGHWYGTSANVAPHSSHTFTLKPHWKGRIWGREVCDDDCTYAGIGSPASLAEFLFKDGEGKDFYDISLVDGYNLPLKIDPIQPRNPAEGDFYRCGSPSCMGVPDCPKELQIIKDGKVLGCKSACSQFGGDEHCCLGEFGEGICAPSSYSKIFKSACPHAYSFAYDDATSMFMCQASGYKVTFC